MADPAILMGIGAPKAGTSWLYHYLRQHPDCHMRGVKELHYFDRLETPDDNFDRDVMQRNAERLRARIAAAPFWRRGALRKDLADFTERLGVMPGVDGGHRAYLEYLTNGAGRKKLVGDITPDYSALDRSHFAQMLALGRDVRFVHVLRDPVDRAWSQARMRGVRRAKGVKPVDRLATRTFDAFLDGREQKFRALCDYSRTLTELLAAVPRERVFLAFYEDLFTEKALARLTAFLGIRRWPADFDRRRHAGQRVDLDGERLARAARLLRGQYAFCEEFFDGRLPERWRSHMVEA